MSGRHGTLQRHGQLRRDYFWNTSASVMLSLTTVVMLLAVVRTAGVWAGGIFSLANALGQQFQTLGMYEVRIYHVTDVRHRFVFGHYLATRLVTVALMIVGIIVYAALTEDDPSVALLVALIAFLRVFDAFEDVFYCEFQRQGRLDLAGKACSARTLSTIVVFSGALVVTRDLLASTVAAIVVTAAVTAAVYIPPARGMFPLRPRWEMRAIGRVLLECLPLFLASFLSIYLPNAPRFAIGHLLDPEQQGYFAIIFMPAFTINLLSTVVFRPLLTQMAHCWADLDWAGFVAPVRRGLWSTVGAFVLIAAVSFVAGPLILRLVYGKDVSGLLLELMVLVVGGAFNAASVILYYALTTMRLQGLVFVGYVVAAVCATALCFTLIPVSGLLGASWAYTISMVVLVLVFAVGILRGRRLTVSRAED